MPVSEETDPELVVNGEAPRSIWPANRVNKPGWPDEAIRLPGPHASTTPDGLLPNEPSRAATADAEAW